MAKPLEDQSLAELITSLASTIPTLIRNELTLLQSQLAFVLARVRTATSLLVVALALAISTVMLLVTAAVSGLALLFLSRGLDPAAAVAVAATCIAIASGVLAGALLIGVRRQFLAAQRTVEQSYDAVSGHAKGERVN